jgi:starch-binding outer membrane protein, SusD/RagB family
MNLSKKFLLIVTLGLVIAGCKKNLEPLDDNHRLLNEIYGDPYFAEGLLMNAYTNIPTNNAANNGYTFSEVATDDAVINDRVSPLLNMATGSWSALNNPVAQWSNSYTAIAYINLFLREIDSVNWSYLNPNVRLLFKDRLKGECYGLRGYFLMNLLQSHAGYAGGGELLGVPIITEPLDQNSNFSKPRNTFDECIQQIYNDLTEAEKYLPLDYVDVTSVSQIPIKYSGIAIGDYNRVFGNANRQRMVGRIVKAIRTKTALLAASPAFNTQNTATKWEQAANYAGEILNLIGGINGLDPQGGLFYVAANINAVNLANGIDQKEMLWRGNIVTNNAIEQTNFPPTLFGNGRVNPTQNLVDAFPMINGYPISDPLSNYVATAPYANRDPRLRNYIVTNGSTFRNTSTFVYTRSDSPSTIDEVNRNPTSTRTGYYLRKLLREDVNLNPSSTSTQKHYPVHIRYTEIFLIYAEAANEAWGPEGKGTFGFSARDVIAAIRKRAGITQPDNYLASITNKDDMRKLIRNERRLELSFEGFRFWDLRRWKENLNEPARGVTIRNNVFTVQTVENRLYSDFMYYGPIPFTEARKANLKQNTGW